MNKILYLKTIHTLFVINDNNIFQMLVTITIGLLFALVVGKFLLTVITNRKPNDKIRFGITKLLFTF